MNMIIMVLNTNAISYCEYGCQTVAGGVITIISLQQTYVPAIQRKAHSHQMHFQY